MSKTSRLYELMSEDLPRKTYQKRLSYRTSKREVAALYGIINHEIFNDQLVRPEIQIMARCREYWGYCLANDILPKLDRTVSNCKIRLSDKWFCKQWLISTLAHEMCHQYQWDVESVHRIRKGKDPIMSHGPTFFKFKDKLAKHGISLKRSHGQKRWFKHQNLFKC